MPLTGELRDMVTRRTSTQEMRQVAGAAGMLTLREAGCHAIAEGVTTVEEVLAHT
jgi:type II secretory ATPase GspE/PulE/Tfp pilus assembly ATPase PilB-like protein